MTTMIGIGLVLQALTLLFLAILVWKSLSGQESGLERVVREEFRAGREENQRLGRDLRESITQNIQSLGKEQRESLSVVVKQVAHLSDGNERRLGQLQNTLDRRIQEMQAGNEKKLEEMRATVDEKLQSTLEKRLSESFKRVSENLEAVQRGLGEMQNLATGVGDLKRVLTNVKSRGTWGEVQLEAILANILSPDQFEKNASIKSGNQVEFAIKLPGRGEAEGMVYLPIDSKFPHEDYDRLTLAAERADAASVEAAQKALLANIEKSAKTIQEKYIEPPKTTDFAILFLPTEGLYAEVLRQPVFAEKLQQKYRIVLAGPTTLAALLNSLRMGFQTLAIEKRTSEVWNVLKAVKTEFGKFGGVLDKVKKKIDEASRTIEEDISRRTRVMESKLQNVEKLPASDAQKLLGLSGE